MTKVLGIVNFEDSVAHIEGLGEYRPVPAMTFLGRYRVIDFVMSNLTNSGIDNIQVFLKEKPRNIIDHLGTGQQYNINSKRGKLRMLYGEKTFSSDVYNTDIANFALNMQYIEMDKNPYVLIAPSYFIYTMDYEALVEDHKASGADVTVVTYKTSDAKTKFLGCDVVTVDKETKKVTEIEINRGKKASATVSLECYVMAKDLFISLVNKAVETSSLYWLKDILKDSLADLDIRTYAAKGYVGCLNSLAAYYGVSMELKDRKTASGLFKKDWPIYTHTSDSSPCTYTATSTIKGSVIANGCTIEGTVDGCVIGRNVTVKKGAVLKNCVVLSNSYIGENSKLENVVVDKYASIHHVKELKGETDAPVYVKRRDRI